MNTGVYIRLIVMGITFCFLIYSWLHYRKTMKKVKLKREEMDERHNERMRQLDEELRAQGRLPLGERREAERRQFLGDIHIGYNVHQGFSSEGYIPSAMFKTDKLSPTKKMITHKMSMT